MKTNKQSEGFYVRLTKKDGDKLRRIAKKSKVSISEIIRGALNFVCL